jgi:hypothetical protein
LYILIANLRLFSSAMFSMTLSLPEKIAKSNEQRTMGGLLYARFD